MLWTAPVLALTWLMPQGRDRSPTIHRYTVLVMSLGAVLMLSQRDYWPLALWLVVCFNALRKPWPARLVTRLSAGVMLYAAYVILKPYSSPIEILGGIVLIALADAAWFLYRREGLWNHHDMLWVMGAACALSLDLMHHWIWFVATACLAGLFITRIGQAGAWFAIASCMYLFLVWWEIASVLFVTLATAGVYVAKDWHRRTDAPDHARAYHWFILLLGGWWKTSWPERLFGLGWDSWRGWAESLQKLRAKQLNLPVDQEQVYTHPHNEYVHILFEHGVVGLVILLGWMGALLYQACKTQPPLLIPAVTLAAIAFTSFPWTLPYETTREHKQYIEFSAFGCIGMVVISLCVLLMIGGQP